MRKYIFPLILGLGGCSILLALGFWQVARLDWKQGILSEIDARITAAPVAVPEAPTEEDDEYLPVTANGQLTGEPLRVLVSLDGVGYRVIQAFDTDDGRTLMIDRGFVPDADKTQTGSSASGTVTGNLLWPNETDGWTPPPDGDLWFARDAVAMGAALNSEPFLIVARETSWTDPIVTPVPIDTSAVPNNHLNYAITWFLLALVWAVMTGYLIFHTAKPKDG